MLMKCARCRHISTELIDVGTKDGVIFHGCPKCRCKTFYDYSPARLVFTDDVMSLEKDHQPDAYRRLIATGPMSELHVAAALLARSKVFSYLGFCRWKVEAIDLDRALEAQEKIKKNKQIKWIKGTTS